MEALKKKYGDLSLRKAFVLTVFLTFCVVVAASAVCIWGCVAFRRYLLPDSDSVWMDLEMTDTDGEVTYMGSRVKLGEEMKNIPRIQIEEDGLPVICNYDLSAIQVSIVIEENLFESLTPKRKLAYQACGIMMVALPLFFSVTGILLCGFFFYRHKLSRPLELLSAATEQIASKDLDFTLSYDKKDEMGRLCRSFEQMRQALDENNRTLWKMIEERKLLQASVAHDLRNPIAIISGYAEYLQLNLPKETFPKERVAAIADHIYLSAGRLKKYTDSMRVLDQMEDMEIHRESVSVTGFARGVAEDFKVVAEGQHLRLEFQGKLPGRVVRLDSDMAYRILENVFTNALRFAREVITVTFFLEEDTLSVSIGDDGEGFPEEMLKNHNRFLMPSADSEEHCGLGLTTSRLLAQKHGGGIEISNGQTGGAAVKIILSV